MRWLLIPLAAAAFLAGCEKNAAKSPERPPPEVSVIEVVPRDTPVSFIYVGQTESSRQVQIRARVDGFLDQRIYTEGSPVKAGQVMFKQDPKPFQAALDAAKGAIAEQRARLQVARDNLARVKPLTAQKALSQKDLDDAIGQEMAAAAAVETAKANVEQAQLNLGYTTIATPVTGLSSYAQVQDGSYVSSANSLLTYVAQLDPIWVNFSLSENDVLKFRRERVSGLLIGLETDEIDVEVVLADGSVFPHKGRITFANADYSPQTGTFLLRATLPNPDTLLRPGQFVRVRLLGSIRPNAILVPQKAVLQGAQGHFVWVIDKEGKAQIRQVQAGSWLGEDWFINSGLKAGERVVVEGMMRLAAGLPVKIVEPTAKAAAGAATPAPGPNAPSAKP
jgi:membrane fusion protein (multidrug efflux system)